MPVSRLERAVIAGAIVVALAPIAHWLDTSVDQYADTKAMPTAAVVQLNGTAPADATSNGESAYVFGDHVAGNSSPVCYQKAEDDPLPNDCAFEPGKRYDYHDGAWWAQGSPEYHPGR